MKHVKFSDLEEDKNYCFHINFPALNPSNVLGFKEISACAIATTIPGFGTIVKELKVCVNESALASFYFDHLISVHEGNCKYFGGAYLWGEDYDSMDDEIPNEADTTINPTEESKISFTSHEKTEITQPSHTEGELSSIKDGNTTTEFPIQNDKIEY